VRFATRDGADVVFAVPDTDGTPFDREPVAANCRTVVGLVLARRHHVDEAEEHLTEARRIAEAWYGITPPWSRPGGCPAPPPAPDASSAAGAAPG
jgi:hypothetical protein